MGGYGSGPGNARDTVDDARRLDVLALARRGCLQPGAVGSSSWTRGGERTASISFVHEVSADRGYEALRLSYTMRPAGAEPEHVAYPVRIERTPCRYGGTRPWFLCPGAGCGRRCRDLYQAGRYFVCRRCADLTYSSSQHSGRPLLAAFNAAERMDRIAERLKRVRSPHRLAELDARWGRLEARFLGAAAFVRPRVDEVRSNGFDTIQHPKKGGNRT